MFDLFGAAWSDLSVEDVEAFLREADEEGVTWEAKADSERSSLRPDSIRKAASGFANQIGGYLILGARKPEGEGWKLPGITQPADEPEKWIGQILRRLQPEPRFAVKAWPREDDRVAIVVQIEPVAVPPCMTPQGRVYERVTGETLPVEDPILLDKLFRRGENARFRGAHPEPQSAHSMRRAGSSRSQSDSQSGSPPSPVRPTTFRHASSPRRPETRWSRGAGICFRAFAQEATQMVASRISKNRTLTRFCCISTSREIGAQTTR